MAKRYRKCMVPITLKGFHPNFMKYPQIHQKERIETIIRYNESLQRDAVYFYLGNYGTRNNPIHAYKCIDNGENLESRVILHTVPNKPAVVKFKRTRVHCLTEY